MGQNIRSKKMTVQRKMNLLLVCVTTMTLGVLAGAAYYYQWTRIPQRLDESAEIAVSRLAENLVWPVWDLDNQKIEKILLGEMKEKQIYAIVLKQRNNETIFKARARDEAWKPTPIESDIGEEGYIHKTKEVKLEAEVMAYVHLYVTPKFLKEELNESAIYMVAGVVVTNIVLVFCIWFGLNWVLVRPINQLSKDMNEGFEQVAMGARQVAEGSSSLAESSSQQAASLEQTSAALEEIAAMIGRNAENADHADQLMADTSRTVSDANASMEQLTQSMVEIAEASSETSKIMKSIDEIAFQTNLLALNAAVEAARAGEAGAGFAVVAGEVRNLAMRVAEAARNTSQLIERTGQRVQNGVLLVEKTNHVFGEVSSTTEKVGGLVSEISEISREQRRGIDSIKAAVAEMDKVTQQNAANAEESAASSEEMNAQTELMRKMIDGLQEMVGAKRNGAKRRSAEGMAPRPAKNLSGSGYPARHAMPTPNTSQGRSGSKAISSETVIPFDDDDDTAFSEF